MLEQPNKTYHPAFIMIPKTWGSVLVVILSMLILFTVASYGVLRWQNAQRQSEVINELSSIINNSLTNPERYSASSDSTYRLDVKRRLDSLNTNLKKAVNGKSTDTAWVKSLLQSTTAEFQSRKQLIDNTQTAMQLSERLMERYERLEEATSIFDNTIGILEMVALLFSIGAAIVLFRFSDDLKKVEKIRDHMSEIQSTAQLYSKNLEEIREKELWQSITTRNPIYLGVHLDSQIQHFENIKEPGKDVQFMLGSLYYAKAHESGESLKYDKSIDYFSDALKNQRSTDRQLREELIHLYLGLVKDDRFSSMSINKKGNTYHDASFINSLAANASAAINSYLKAAEIASNQPENRDTKKISGLGYCNAAYTFLEFATNPGEGNIVLENGHVVNGDLESILEALYYFRSARQEFSIDPFSCFGLSITFQRLANLSMLAQPHSTEAVYRDKLISLLHSKINARAWTLTGAGQSVNVLFTKQEIRWLPPSLSLPDFEQLPDAEEVYNQLQPLFNTCAFRYYLEGLKKRSSVQSSDLAQLYSRLQFEFMEEQLFEFYQQRIIENAYFNMA